LHRLPDRTRLSPVIPVFVGLLRAGEGREINAAVSLYNELLSGALASLPPRITRLVVAADGALHQLPLSSLRATPTSPPLGAKYELVYVPSATLWRHWRVNPRPFERGRPPLVRGSGRRGERRRGRQPQCRPVPGAAPGPSAARPKTKAVRSSATSEPLERWSAPTPRSAR
jgi:hypothetical protein